MLNVGLVSFQDNQNKGFSGSFETLKFQQIANHLVLEGTVPVPPNRPFALRWCCSTSSGIIAPGGCQSGGAEALRAVAQKER